jgi:hypothetical protein
MTYDATEISQQSGAPVELYKFVGTHQNYFYASGPVNVTFLGDLYVSTPMRRSNVATGTHSDDNLEVTIEIPITSDIIADYGFSTSPPELTLTIYRYHTAAEYVQYWEGPVENIKVRKAIATIRVPSALAASLTADVPNVYYQSPCNNTLYDDVCGVVFADFSASSVITAVAANVITITDVGVLDGLLVGGEASLPSGERRMITEQTGNVITVNYQFSSIAVSDTLTFAAGCDLNWAGDCATKFSNQLRHTGFNFIPNDNVFETGLEPGVTVVDNTCLPSRAVAAEGWTHEWTFEVQDPAANSPSLSFLQVNYPGVGGVYDWNDATGAEQTIFSRTTVGGGFQTPWIQTWKMNRDLPVGSYEILFDPTNSPGTQTYIVYFRTNLEETATEVGRVTSSSGSPRYIYKVVT